MALNRKIARIDLASHQVEVCHIPYEWRRKFLSGRGLGAYLLFRNLTRGCDPLKPPNCAVISTGILGATGAGFFECAGVSTKSPLTRLVTFFPVFGGFAGEMRWAGYDHLIITGKAKHPIFLCIRNGEIELRDGKRLIGKSAPESFAIIRKDLKDDDIRAILIDPPGEDRIGLSGIITDCGWSSGKTGLGSVLNSKNIKGIVCRGGLDLEVKHPSKLLSFYKELFDRFVGSSDWSFKTDPFMPEAPSSFTGEELIAHSQWGMKMPRMEINEMIADSLGLCNFFSSDRTPIHSIGTIFHNLIQMASGLEISESDLIDIAFRCRAIERLLDIRETSVDENLRKTSSSGIMKKDYRNFSEFYRENGWDKRSLVKLRVLKTLEIDELWPLMR